MIPTFAIVGRPNVGKSTLFNRLLRRGVAISHGVPGVTRDRIFAQGKLGGRTFSLVDTGGMVLEGAGEDFETEVFEQATEAMEEAQVILLVMDGRDGLTSLDEKVAEYVRQSNKPVVLVVNKVDGEELESEATADFHVLGYPIMSVSASHGYRINELREEVARMLQEFPEEEEESEEEKGLKIAMLGRPNAGKSSMVNALTGKTRLIVSPIAGTTRDSVDVSFESRGQRYTFVDTAGVRRRAQVRDSLERFSVMRALKSSKRADVVVLVLDGPQGLTRQDKRLLEFLVKEKTPFMVAVNKMDLVGKSEKAEFKLDMEFAMRICPHVPLVYTSTITRAGLGSILAMARTIWEECQVRITTGQLNRAMEQVLSRHQPPLVKGRRAKFYYLTQAQTNPPVFVFFVNKVENIKTSYRRYLENSLRKLFAIKYAPIGIHFRSSHGDKKK